MEVFHTNEETKKSVRNYFGVTEESVKKDILILKEWLKKQEHLPKDQDDDFLELVLLRNKFRIEQTKKKIDAYYSLKNHYKQYFQNVPIGNVSKEYNQVIVLPKLTPKLERIIISKLRCPGAEEYNCPRNLQHAFIIAETKIRHDYSIGDRIILDATHFTFEHFKKLTATALRDLQNIYQKAYTGRIIGMHFVNSPPFLNLIVSLLKQVLKPKLFQRIVVHDNFDSLHEFIPKDCLPEIYGGTGENLESLIGTWDEYLTKNSQVIQECFEKTSNEKLRVGKSPYSDLIELEGTFKRLEID